MIDPVCLCFCYCLTAFTKRQVLSGCDLLAQWHFEYEYSLSSGSCSYITKKSVGMHCVSSDEKIFANTSSMHMNWNVHISAFRTVWGFLEFWSPFEGCIDTSLVSLLFLSPKYYMDTWYISLQQFLVCSDETHGHLEIVRNNSVWRICAYNWYPQDHNKTGLVYLQR